MPRSLLKLPLTVDASCSADCGEGNICWIQTGNAADDSCQGECRQREETCQDDEIAAMFSWVPAVEAADSTRCQGCMQTSREMPVLEGLGCIHNALLCSHVEGTLSNDSTEGLLKMLSWLAGWLQGPVIACGTLDVHLDALDVVLGLGSDELSVISNVIAALRMSATRLFHILPESLREEAQLILQLLGKAETSLQRVLPLRDASLFGTCNPMLDSMETKRTIGEALLQNVAPGESVQIRSDQGTMTVVSLKDKDANINLTDVRSGGSTVRPSVKLTLIEACKAVPGLCPDQLLVILTYTYRMAYLMLALPPRVLAAAVLAYGMDVPDGFAVGLVSGQISIQIPGLENIMYRDFVVQQPPSRRMMLDAYVAAVSYSFPLPPTAVIEMAFPLDQQMMLAAAAGSPNRPVFCSRIFYAPSLGLEVIGMANLSDDRMSASCETNSTGEFVVVMVSPLASMGRGASVR